MTEQAPLILVSNRGPVTYQQDGSVKRATVISEVCPECDRAALDAIRRYRFKPARDGENRPVEATFAIPLPL